MAHFKIDSEVSAEKLSRDMYSIMNPGDDSVTHLFPWGTDKNGQPYIEVDLNMECPIYVNENFQKVLNEVGAMLGIESATEGRALVVLGNLIPSTLEEFTPEFEVFSKPF